MTQNFDNMIDNGNDPDEFQETTELAVPNSVYSSAATFLPEDVAPPMLKLMQGLSPEVQAGEARPGQWLMAGTSPRDSLIVVPLSYARRREYRDADTNAVTCASYDGEQGEGDPGGYCTGCPMNQWTGEGKSRKGPQCVFFYSYQVFLPELGQVAIYNFKRTGLATGKQMNSIVARSGFGKAVVRFSSKQNTGGKGNYSIPSVAQVTGADAETAIQLAREFFGE